MFLFCNRELRASAVSSRLQNRVATHRRYLGFCRKVAGSGASVNCPLPHLWSHASALPTDFALSHNTLNIRRVSIRAPECITQYRELSSGIMSFTALLAPSASSVAHQEHGHTRTGMPVPPASRILLRSATPQISRTCAFHRGVSTVQRPPCSAYPPIGSLACFRTAAHDWNGSAHKHARAQPIGAGRVRSCTRGHPSGHVAPNVSVFAHNGRPRVQIRTQTYHFLRSHVRFCTRGHVTCAETDM